MHAKSPRSASERFFPLFLMLEERGRRDILRDVKGLPNAGDSVLCLERGV